MEPRMDQHHTDNRTSHPVCWLVLRRVVHVDGMIVGELRYDGDVMLDPMIWIGDVKLTPNQLRAIADFLDCYTSEAWGDRPDA
jgi:hypothetical protein